MAYITAADIVTRYGLDYLRLPSDHNEDGQPDLAPVTVAIEDAESEINKHIAAGGYDIPLVDVDTNLAWSWVRRCTADLAIYYLAATSDVMTEIIKERMEACMLQLKEIADGTLVPGGPASPTQNSARLVGDPRRLRRTQTCWLI